MLLTESLYYYYYYFCTANKITFSEMKILSRTIPHLELSSGFFIFLGFKVQVLVCVFGLQY